MRVQGGRPPCRGSGARSPGQVRAAARGKRGVFFLNRSSAPARKLPTRPQPSAQKQSELKELPGGKGFKKVKNKIKLFSVRLGMDMTFLFLVLLLVIIGIIMMYSASYPSALRYTDDSQKYLISQSIFAAAGFGIMIGMSYFDYHNFHFLAPFIYIGGLGLLVVVLMMPGDPKRWISIGSFGFQASEVAKFALILALADWSSKHFRDMHTFKTGVLPPLIMLVLYLVLLYKEPHYSGMVIMLILAAIMMFIGGVKLRYFVIAGALIGVVLLYLVATNQLGYAMQRLDGWGQALTYTTEDMWQKTYQTRNSLYAIGSGGVWGLGLGQSRQKYMYIPEAQNDFVFAVVCEEMGLIGAVLILLVFVLLVWRGITISMRAKDPFGSMLGTGLSAQIGIQAILNILVITDWLPNTGISLPFFSYGGTSLIMLMAQMGIVLSISRTSNLEKV